MNKRNRLVYDILGVRLIYRGDCIAFESNIPKDLYLEDYKELLKAYGFSKDECDELLDAFKTLSDMTSKYLDNAIGIRH